MKSLPNVDDIGCRDKDDLANAKLQQMVSGQNEAERRKGEAETLSKDLEQQNDRIAERRYQARSGCFCFGFFVLVRFCFDFPLDFVWIFFVSVCFPLIFFALALFWVE